MPGKKPSRPTPSPSSSRTAKTPLKPSPTTPLTPSHQDPHLLSSASTLYPHLISPSATLLTISTTDPSPPKPNNPTIYLSTSFFSPSLIPSSLVSISLPSSSPDFPLDSFGSNLGESGCFFAIATALLCSKVPTNGARLSWDLSSTMGFPDTGRSVFVSPIMGIHICKCQDLHLSLVPPKDGVSISSDAKIESVGVNSPKTPSPQSHLSSPVANRMHTRKPCESAMGGDSSVVRLVLEDDKEVSEELKVWASRWLYGRRVLIGNFVILPIAAKLSLFQVESASGTEPNDMDEVGAAFLVDTKTKIYLSASKSPYQENSHKVESPAGGVTSNVVRDTKAREVPRLGGLSKEFAEMMEIITLSLVNKNVLPSLRYKGVLLHGPPGTGKTSLVSSCVHEAGVSLLSINGPEVVSQYFGESEQALREVFDSARRDAPAVVFIDELDAIAPARKDGGEDLSLRLVATLLTLMDQINGDDGILVIAATNRPDTIDPSLRRPGRFDREFEIGVPSPNQRLDILQTLLCEINHSLNDKEIQSLASATHGFVGADLAALCNEAAMAALRRSIKLKTPSSRENLDSLVSSLSELTVSSNSSPPADSREQEEEGIYLKVTPGDIEKAKVKVRPSAMREVMLELPKVRWEDVGGQIEAKKKLMEAVQWPPDAFERMGIRPPRGLLMFGPPGCSKTLLARAVASEAKLNFLAVKGPELFSKWVGDSEKAVSSLFAKARANSPAIIFFDELDGLAVTRGQENDGTSVADRVLSQLLVEMDGLNQRLGVIVIGATNRPDKIDPALLRPGRFDDLIDILPPDEADREKIFQIHTRSMPCSSDVCLKDLARLTEGYTGADIKLTCTQAAIAALEESFEIKEVSMVHFKIGIGRVEPADLQFYKELAAKFKR